MQRWEENKEEENDGGGAVVRKLVQMAGCERKKEGEEDNDRWRWVAIGAEGDGVC